MPRKKKQPTGEEIETLLELVKLGAGASFADVSSTGLGKALVLTQQAASKRLIDLERNGLVERVRSGRGLGVRLTDSGLAEVSSLYGRLKGALESARNLRFRGRVFTGLREGRYYVSLEGYAKPFRDTLGFVPFPGTLNLRLPPGVMVEQRRGLNLLNGVQVAGFEDRLRTYGPVKCFRAQVGGKYPGAALAIERTHYDDTVLEVISPINLRKVLKLRDGDECSVTVYPV